MLWGLARLNSNLNTQLHMIVHVKLSHRLDFVSISLETGKYIHEKDLRNGC